MARKPDELKQYVEDLAKEKGLTDTQTKIGIAFMTGDREALKDVSIEDLRAAVVPIADLAVGRRADHSRAMNAAQQAHTKAVVDYEANQTWRKDAKAEYDKALADRTALQSKVAKYESEYGALDETVDIGGGNTVTQTGDIVRTKDIEALRAQIETQTTQKLAGQFMQFQLEEGNLSTAHFARFKEPLNKARLIEVMAEHNANNPKAQPISLTQAYQLEYGDKVVEMDTAARAAELKAAEDRGVAKGRTAAAAALGRSGAAVPEIGIVFDRINTERKAGDKPVVDAHSDEEGAALFAQDLEQFSRTTDDNAATTQ